MSTFLRLVRFLRPFTGWVILAVVLGVATIASNVGLLGASAYLIASAALHPSIAVLQVAIVGVRFFGISRGVFRYLERLSSHAVNFRLLGNIRLWFYRQLEPLAPAGLQEAHSADLLSRSVADIETLQDFFSRVVAPPAVALLVVAGVCLFMSGYHPTLAVILLAGLLAAGVGLPFLSSWISRSPAHRLLDRRADLTRAVVDGLQGLPDLEACDQSGRHLAHFRAINDEVAGSQQRLAWAGGLVYGLNVLIVNLTMLGILMLAITLTSTGVITGVDLAVLVLVALASFEAATPLGLAAQHLVASLRAARRLFEVADRPPLVHEPAQPAQPPRLAALSIRDLSFQYPGEKSFELNNIDFDLPPGKRIGILGPTGSGKSTLLNLILRFWEYDRGHILLDGKDLKNYASADVRALVAVISQSTYIFTATLRENLSLACPSAGEASLLKAIDQAQLAGWLHTLPRGLDTWLGEHGVLMSGGERQRLALARALLRDAALYLLDEPASQLDAETENRLVDCLLQATRGKSLLWASHSLVGMQAMDEILVFQNGHIVERGSPAELIARRGIYARMSGTFSQRIAS